MSYINSRTINHFAIYSYTVLYGFNQLLTNPLRLAGKMGVLGVRPFFPLNAGKGAFWIQSNSDHSTFRYNNIVQNSNFPRGRFKSRNQFLTIIMLAVEFNEDGPLLMRRRHTN